MAEAIRRAHSLLRTSVWLYKELALSAASIFRRP
jgi:hypothetical protein